MWGLLSRSLSTPLTFLSLRKDHLGNTDEKRHLTIIVIHHMIQYVLFVKTCVS